MKVRLKYVEVHKGQPVFLKGNLGDKLIPKNKPGMIVERDMEDGSVYVSYQGEVLILERTSVFSWAPENNADVGFENQTVNTNVVVAAPIPSPMVEQAQVKARGFKSAQVATPGDGGIRLESAPKYRPHPLKVPPVDPNDVKKP